MRRFFAFGLAGAAGFVVDAGVLALTLGWLGPWWGRALSFLAAVATTWAVNRNTTFRDRPSRYSLPVEFLRYLLAMCVGGSINYAVYAAVVAAFGSFGLVPFAALALGTLAGMGVNLALAHHAVFRP